MKVDTLEDRFELVNIERSQCIEDCLFFTLEGVLGAHLAIWFIPLDDKLLSTATVCMHATFSIVIDRERLVAGAIRAHTKDGLLPGRFASGDIFELLELLGRRLIRTLRLIDISLFAGVQTG